MPEDTRWCGDAADVMTFLEIDLAVACITETFGRRSGDRLADRIERFQGRRV